MPKATTLSDENNSGSVAPVDYHNYPYDSHHVEFLNGFASERHSPIDSFSKDCPSQDGIKLGYGTYVAAESEQKHKADMEEQLRAIDIDQKFQLEQKMSEEEAKHAQAQV